MAQQLERREGAAAKRSPREAITQALVELMDEKPFESISITEVVQRAGVGRSSFYRHFSGKKDVLLQHLNVLFDWPRDYGPDREHDMEDYLLMWFQDVKRDRAFFETLQRNGMLELIYTQLASNIQYNLETYDLKLHKYQPIFFMGAAVAVIIAWIEGGFEESEEEINEIFLSILYNKLDW